MATTLTPTTATLSGFDNLTALGDAVCRAV